MKHDVAAAVVAVMVAAAREIISNPDVPAAVKVTVTAFGAVRFNRAIAAGFVMVTVVPRSVTAPLADSAV